MQERQRGHRHVALVAKEHGGALHADTPAAGGVSLLRLSVPARLAMVAIASALLWVAVLWALA